MKSPTELNFDQITPVAPQGLGGLVAEHFGNGRLFAKVCAHGGLTDIGYWGKQHVGAFHFFNGASHTAWVKLFRAYAGVGDKRYYLTLHETRLYPFGYSSRAEVECVRFQHELLLLPDAVVHRLRVESNPEKLPVRIEALHHEGCTATIVNNRTWGDFEFVPKINAMIASCTDLNPEVHTLGNDCLHGQGIPLVVKDSPKATTWIGIGCDSPLSYRGSYPHRNKHYLAGSNIKKDSAAIFLVFAHSRKELEARLAQLSKSVHGECDAVLSGYEKRLLSRPQINTGNKILNSAFSQFPEFAQQMKVPDRPGAARATLAGYFVWGWDNLNVAVAAPLANEADSAAQTLRFFQQTRHKQVGLLHAFTGSFEPLYKGPFAWQAQFIAALYHVVSTSGDLSLAREMMPTCKFILDRCRERLVKGTGFVEGPAMWPDRPEAMDENGHDISSMNNSLLYQGLRSMEFLAAAVGDKKLAADCRDWAKTLRASFVKYLYDEEKGFFISSCDSQTLKPRKHYCPQSVFWVTPFARELLSHAPQRIAEFLNKELRTDKCLLTLPHWDTAWMADGNQLGSTFPAADPLYLNAQKLVGNAAGLELWLGDVEWFWRRHTAPEAFTPEAENEADIGVDEPGNKQLQTVSNWYFGLYTGLAGLDFDHEGITITPWGERPLSIKRVILRGVSVDLEIKGAGTHVGSLKLNGRPLPAGARKILWSQLKGKTAKIELVRSNKAPGCPVIVRADGLRVEVVESGKGTLLALVEGAISGEVVIQAPASAKCSVDGQGIQAPYDPATGTLTIPIMPGSPSNISIGRSSHS